MDISGGYRSSIINLNGQFYGWNGDEWVLVSIEALSAIEMAYIDGLTPGTQEASKAVVPDANVNTGVSKVTELHIGTSGSETDVSAELALLDGLLADSDELNILNGATVDVDELNQLASTFARLSPGKLSFAHIDFNAVGTAAMTITINGVAYLEADAEDLPNGVWSNGADAAASATSLIAAINGDARAAVPFTAVADASGDGVWLVQDTVGANTDTVSSDDGSATVQSFTGGTAAAVGNTCQVEHTVTTQELLAGAQNIPLPFAPITWSVQVRSATGLMRNDVTDLFTLTGSTIVCTQDGATSVVNTDTITVTAFA